MQQNTCQRATGDGSQSQSVGVGDLYSTVGRSCLRETGFSGERSCWPRRKVTNEVPWWSLMWLHMLCTFINDFGIKRPRMLRKFNDDTQLGCIANVKRAGISNRKKWVTSRFGVIGTGWKLMEWSTRSDTSGSLTICDINWKLIVWKQWRKGQTGVY